MPQTPTLAVPTSRFNSSVVSACWLLLVSSIGILKAQTTRSEQQLTNILVGKQFVLRDFAAEPEVRYSWRAGRLDSTEPKVRMLAVFTPDGVTYTPGKVVVTGHRQAAVLNQAHELALAQPVESVRLIVDYKDADPLEVLSKLRDDLFFEHISTAVHAVPPQFAGSVPPSALKRDVFVAEGCDECVWVEMDGRWSQVQKTNFVAAKLLHTPEPTSPLEVRINGIVGCAAAISNKGDVSEVWITKALDVRFDEPACLTIKQYAFAPARKDGAPVGSIGRFEHSFRRD